MSRKIISYFGISIGLILNIFGGYWIGKACTYSRIDGPFNFDISVIQSIIGFSMYIIGPVILRFNWKQNKFFLYLYYILISILLFSFGMKVMSESEVKLSRDMPPGMINLGILYFSSIGLFLFGLIRLKQR